MKILLFECKKAHDGSVFDFPFDGDRLLFLMQPVKIIQISQEQLSDYTQVRVYGLDRLEVGG
jgi:hypothetical protein